LIALGCYALYASPYARADEGTLPTFILGIVTAELAATRSRHAEWLSMVTSPLIATARIWQARVAVIDHGNPLWAVAAFLVVVNATCGPLARGFSSRPRPQSASVDGDVAISELIRLGLVETVWSDGGAAYRAGRKLRLGRLHGAELLAIGRRSMSSRASSAIRTARMAGE